MKSYIYIINRNTELLWIDLHKLTWIAKFTMRFRRWCWSHNVYTSTRLGIILRFVIHIWSISSWRRRGSWSLRNVWLGCTGWKFGASRFGFDWFQGGCSLKRKGYILIWVLMFYWLWSLVFCRALGCNSVFNCFVIRHHKSGISIFGFPSTGSWMTSSRINFH